jgi:hypothetical protein
MCGRRFGVEGGGKREIGAADGLGGVGDGGRERIDLLVLGGWRGPEGERWEKEIGAARMFRYAEMG